MFVWEWMQAQHCLLSALPFSPDMVTSQYDLPVGCRAPTESNAGDIKDAVTLVFYSNHLDDLHSLNKRLLKVFLQPNKSKVD